MTRSVDDVEIKRPNNSDELGEMGEGNFQKICASAKLICNKSHRDRSGWDFIVEHPVSDNRVTTLDKRSNPISSLFQLKSLWAENDQIKFRVSSLERLAKDPKPAFIYITKFKNDSSVSDVLLIHLLDDNLAVVLQKLRKLEAEGIEKVNNEYMHLTASKYGTRIGGTGQDLRSEIDRLIGTDINAYLLNKSQQLMDLGYELRRNLFSATLKFKNEEEFADVMLGFSSVPFENAVSQEVRFGIALQKHDFPQSGRIKLIPTPRDTCSVIVRRHKFQIVCSFAATLLMAPTLGNPRLLSKIVIASDLFTISLSGDVQSFQSVQIGLEAPIMNAAAWRNWFAFALELSSGGCDLEIKPKRLKTQKLHFSGKVTGIETEHCIRALRSINDIIFILDECLGVGDIEFGYGAIVKNLESSTVCAALVRGDETLTAKMFAEGIPADFAAERMYGKYADVIVLGDKSVLVISDATFDFEKEDGKNLIVASDLIIDTIELVDTNSIDMHLDNARIHNNNGVVMCRNYTDDPEWLVDAAT